VIKKDIEEERDTFQAKYDKDRARTTAGYIEERNGFLLDGFSCIYGCLVCLGCSHPFSPQEPREALVGWKRCSTIVGCASSKRFCPDCSSEPCCQRCFAPICGAHKASHDEVAAATVTSVAGSIQGTSSKIMELGMANGCCGKSAGYWRCDVHLCYVCTYRSEPTWYPPDHDPEQEPLCPKVLLCGVRKCIVTVLSVGLHKQNMFRNVSDASAPKLLRF
jgi:hypothetical protein